MSVAASSKKRRGLVWRILRWFTIAVLVTAALLILLVSTSPGGRLIALTFNRLGSGPEQNIEIDRIDGLFSGSTRIGHVLVSDASGEPWLLVKGIRVDWSALALVTSGLTIDDLSIERVELARLPEAGEARSESGGSLQLPLAINVKRLRAPDILLGEPVAGKVARFEASGSLVVDAAVTTALADLTINRIDGVGGQFTMEADYLKGEDRFNVSANLSEPAGGVMAHLLQLSPRDAISISATSQGLLDDWRLSVDGVINGEAVASANLKLVASEAGDAVSLQAGGRFDRFLPPALRQFAEGRSELILEGIIEPDQSGATIDIFTFASARLSAQGRGRVAREGQIDLTASVSPQAGSQMLRFGNLPDGVSLTAPEAEIRVSGSAEEATVRLVVSTERINSADFGADQVSAVVDFGRFSLASRSGEGRIDINIDAIGSANEMLARAVAGGLRISGDVSIGDDGAITSKKIEIRSGVAALLLSTIAIETAGAVRADASAVLRSAVLSPQAEGLLGETLQLAAELSRDPDGAAALRNFGLSSETAEASGNAALGPDGDISGEAQIRLASLAGFNDAVAGGLQLSARVSGPSSAPAFEVALIADALTVQGKDLSGLRLDANGVADPASPQADIALSGSLDGQAISGAAKLGRSGGVVRIDPLRLQVASNLISGSLRLDDDYRPQGVIDIDLRDIGSLSALALQDIDGNGGGRLSFDVRDAKSIAEIALGFPALSGDGFTIGDARINLAVDDLLARRARSAWLKSQRLRRAATISRDCGSIFRRSKVGPNLTAKHRPPVSPYH